MKLVLENGKSFEGESFGAPETVTGEVVFNTGMVGYVESLSDPSYAGQILVLTYPLIGNYGVPGRRFFESGKIQAAGLIVANYSETYSHYAAEGSLGAWLKREKIPAMTGVDTRMLTKILREKGVMLGALVNGGRVPKLKDPNVENLVARVSPRVKKTYGKGGPRIILVDCGAKENIVRSLVARGASVLRVPWDYDFNKERADGIVLSNGPGDPVMCAETIANIRKAYEKGKPILGICLGTQLMALAAGGSTFKLKYGHRSHNQPAIDEGTKRSYITSQNHGYAVDAATLPKEWKVWFTNANDGSVEGIRHKTKPWSAVQFHPEASPGPTDTGWVFDEFLEQVTKSRRRHYGTKPR
ncbi:MAG: glutamine-hydrolyzing carbamoyl-phosphate synthase small subunit [Patescibacteria group bacterium]